MYLKTTHLALFLFFSILSSAQITVVNPSFEDSPGDATVPKGWHPCEEGTTPDILPGFWGEYGEPSKGQTFVGMITRENSTWESIGQRLSIPLKKGECYKFSIDLAQGYVYSGYNNPIKLRVWIGENNCNKKELIYESSLVTNEDWKTHFIQFNPKSGCTHIILEAFHSEDDFNYKGNILIDNMTPIVDCGRA